MKGALQLLAVSAAAALGGVHAFIPSLPSSTPVPAVAGPKGVAAAGVQAAGSSRKASRVVLHAAGGGDGETTFKIQVTGNNIEVTPAMREYVQKKLGKVLAKLPLHDAVQRLDVHLSVVVVAHAAKHSHTCEATVFMKGGQVLRASEETDYMYASIDLVSHRLTRLLRKYKDRKLGKRKVESQYEEDTEAEIAAMNAAAAAAMGAGGDFEDPAKAVDMRVVKKKAFDMPPMSVQDAIVCLDYIGHDFYVFQNQDTNAISVVYKRKLGGYGLIEPSK